MTAINSDFYLEDRDGRMLSNLGFDFPRLARQLAQPVGTVCACPEYDFRAFRRIAEESGWNRFTLRPIVLVDSMLPFPPADLFIQLLIPRDVAPWSVSHAAIPMWRSGPRNCGRTGSALRTPRPTACRRPMRGGSFSMACGPSKRTSGGFGGSWTSPMRGTSRRVRHGFRSHRPLMGSIYIQIQSISHSRGFGAGSKREHSTHRARVGALAASRAPPVREWPYVPVFAAEPAAGGGGDADRAPDSDCGRTA